MSNSFPIRPTLIQPASLSTGRALTATTTQWGYIIQEGTPLMGAGGASGMVWRSAGGMMIAFAYLQWYFPMLWDRAGSAQLHVALGVILLGLGIGIYWLAGRRYRRSLVVDLSNRTLGIGLSGTHNSKLTRQKISMDRIESMFVKPCDQTRTKATLNVRLKGDEASVAMLCAERAELDSWHRKLCDDVHVALECRPRRVKKRPLKSGYTLPERPMLEPADNQVRAVPIAAE